MAKSAKILSTHNVASLHSADMRTEQIGSLRIRPERAFFFTRIKGVKLCVTAISQVAMIQLVLQ